MKVDFAEGSDTFEPPKYLASLITAVNEGAKSAQASALFFALIGLYLLATAFSASDEDLLLGRTVTISQIGASLPVSFSFVIAPAVFVFLHIQALVRYDLLAANVRQFLADLRQTVPLEADRERCRQLLANVDFIQAMAAAPGSRFYSRLWRYLGWAVIAIFPVAVLLAVQTNALRYQSELITWLQRFVLFIDLFALVWFFRRTSLDGSAPQSESGPARIRQWIKLLWGPVIVCVLNLLYLNVVPAEANSRLVRYERDDPSQPFRIKQYLLDVARQPVDVGLCYWLGWGCRFLRVENRTLIDHSWDDKAIADLRSGAKDYAQALTAIEGKVLRNRSLRFAAMEGTSLYRADLTDDDLRNADLGHARLSGSKLVRAQLKGANLSGAELKGAELSFAILEGATLSGAKLQGAYLDGALLQGANLVRAELQGSTLSDAKLQAAVLVNAKLKGALLSGAVLHGAMLWGAELQGADLVKAELQGAALEATQMQGADLGGARLWGGRLLVSDLDLSLSNLQEADFSTPLTSTETKRVRAAIDTVADSSLRQFIEDQLLRRPIIEGQSAYKDQSEFRLNFVASPERQVLVSDPRNEIFENVPKEWLITSPTPSYVSALITLLVDDLASADPAIAEGIGSRTLSGLNSFPPNDQRRFDLYAPVACRLLANVRADKVKLGQRTVDLLSSQLKQHRFKCPLDEQTGEREASHP